MSDFQDYIEYIKNTLPANPPVYICINKTDSRLVFRTKYGYNLEIQTPEYVKLFASKKELIDKTKNGENVPTISDKILWEF